MRRYSPQAPLRLLVASQRADVAHVLEGAPLDLIEVVGRSRTGAEALASARIVRPDVVLAEAEGAGLDGLELAARISQEFSDLAVVLISDRGDGELVRKAMWAGARDFLVRPLDVSGTVEALRRVGKRMAIHRDPAAGEGAGNLAGSGVWAFLQPMAGNGQTTLAVSLARELVRHGRRVVVVDLDPFFGDLGFYLGMGERLPHIGDLIRSGKLEHEPTIEAHLVVHPSGIRVLLPPEDSAEAFVCEPDRVIEVVRALGRVADYILLDMPAGVPQQYFPLLDEARFLFLSCNGKLASFKNLRKMVRLLQRIGHQGNALLPVLTGYRSNEAPLAEYQELLARMGVSLGQVFPYDWMGTRKAIRRGVALNDIDPESEWAASIREFLVKLLGLPVPERRQSLGQRARRFLGRLVSTP